MGSTTLFNAVFIRPEQVVRFLLCISYFILHRGCPIMNKGIVTKYCFILLDTNMVPLLNIELVPSRRVLEATFCKSLKKPMGTVFYCSR